MEKSQNIRSKLTQVFQFLQALDQIKNPVEKDVNKQPWNLWLFKLPQHKCIEVASTYINNEELTDSDEVIATDNYVLKVTRPENLPIPEPPEEIKHWLDPGWDNCNRPVSIHKIIELDDNGNEITIDLHDDSERLASYDNWLQERDKWADEQKVINQVRNVFENIYDLYSQIQRESEQVELVLGDGVLNWPHPKGINFNHPLILQRLELKFEPLIPQFIFTESDKNTELYSPMLRSIPEISPGVISNSLEIINKGGIHPLEIEDTTKFLTSLAPQIAPKGEYLDSIEPPEGEKDIPRIARSRIIFLRKRNLGFGVAIESILENLPEKDLTDVPNFLPRVFGIETDTNSAEDLNLSNLDPNGEDEEVLFSKEANSEQLQIAKFLNNSGSVLVQGPPGTGKTHTIGNLVGHFLAQGKSILITSHSSKALQVLRDKVVPPLQPLCVSVLSDDNRNELENSIDNITEKLSNSNASILEAEADQLFNKRVNLLNKRKQLRNDLKIARYSEYTPIVLDGVEYKPIEAAKSVAKGMKINDWIPSPISKDEPCPISDYECNELYRLNASLTLEDENNFSLTLPLLDNLLDPPLFKNLVQLKKELEAKDLSVGETYWRNSEVEAEQIRNSFNALIKAIQVILNSAHWLRNIAIQGINETEKGMWYNLQQMVSDTNELSLKYKELVFEYGPHFETDLSPEEIKRITDEIYNHVSSSGKLSSFKLFLKPQWKSFINSCSVNGYSPSMPQHFEALKVASDIQLARYKMQQRWNRQMESITGPIVDSDDGIIERTCLLYCNEISLYLNWYSEQWLPAAKTIVKCGLDWDEVMKQIPHNLEQLDQYVYLVNKFLPDIVQSKINMAEYKAIIKQLSNLEKALSELPVTDGVCKDLLTAVKSFDTISYEKSYKYLTHLHKQASNYRKRNELLDKVRRVAPTWADFIRNKRDIHGNDVPPGKVINAWIWRQLNDELDRRSNLIIDDIQKDIVLTGTELRTITGHLVEKRAWATQIRRIDDKQRLALQGWKMTIRKIGKGTGARAPKLKLEARKLMPKCQSAVPVWIMPLARVVDNFNPSTIKFDVIIIDEASQADLMALIAVYMGKQIIIVGDDEQVSPIGVGQKVDELQRLIEIMLKNIPNKHLYDSTFSIYDLAMTILQPICLREHFRCVPEIINFSNRLSYDWKIKPLRDTSSILVKPHVVGYRIEGATINGKKNKLEAITIASLIAACTQEPEYNNSSFGVISLLGEEQALYIDSLLRRFLEPTIYAKRKIQCGNSAHFQGDERNIIFLSMVDTCETNGPLSIRADGFMGMYKKRYNVATSRAQDQLWVVYSLNPETDLKDGDLRLQLIQHAKDPNSFSREREKVLVKVESDFEKQVADILMNAGYKVIPQWKVGSFRIDMVVEDNGKRLAIECDGDKYHTLENLQDDLNRQAILERLGWTFIRIRGTQFYRNSEQTMIPIFEMLKYMGIKPSSNTNLGTTNNQKYDLLDRVKRKAAELRDAWENGKAEIYVLDNKTTKKQFKRGKQKVSEIQNETPINVEMTEAIPLTLNSEVNIIQNKLFNQQPAIESATKNIKASITQMLEKEGLDFIDNRDKEGALWVVGGRELKDVMEKLKTNGYDFRFTNKGSKVTKHLPGWYYK